MDTYQGDAAQFEAYLNDYEESLKSPDFWLDKAKRLDWDLFPKKSLTGGYKEGSFTWFEDGKLNVSVNCVDRHAKATPDKTAIIWAKDQLGEYERISFKDLKERVCQFTNALIDLGVKKGDRVCLYLPMIPELPVAMLACARIGAIHSVVFAGFSSKALRDRIEDCQSEIVITSNEGLRGGKAIPLKEITNEAIKGLDCVKKVIVKKYTDTEVASGSRDIDWDELIEGKSFQHIPESFAAETPLFILYTSGSTGKPKGLLHTSGGYLTYASFTHENVFACPQGSERQYFCAADIGWITGHSYIVYGPLANGVTTVMFESTPVYPDASRYWKIIDDLKIDVFYTAPTALRALAQKGDSYLEGTSRESLKVLGTVGEPINPEIWHWYYDKVGKNQTPIVDTWWQTETGGILISPIPGVTPLKAGSATRPLYGIDPLLVEASTGEELIGNAKEGALCLRNPWPGQARTIYGDHDRYLQVYFSQYQGLYFAGDGAKRDESGDYWITGRIDDVINVSGHRLGTAEIESAIMKCPLVGEVAVVGFDHEIKGTGIFAYIIKQEDSTATDEVIQSATEFVAKEIGKIARPDKIQICTGLPKTRSGKVMRRILRKIAGGEYKQLGDISTLADPAVVEGLIQGHKDLS
ncbi:MAG: acetate--CoA ligase [Bacteriovoracaceae bacterium]